MLAKEGSPALPHRDGLALPVSRFRRLFDGPHSGDRGGCPARVSAGQADFCAHTPGHARHHRQDGIVPAQAPHLKQGESSSSAVISPASTNAGPASATDSSSRLMARAGIDPEIGAVLPMERAEDGFREMWEGRTRGKTVFTR
jgi:hypothetical protein